MSMLDGLGVEVGVTLVGSPSDKVLLGVGVGVCVSVGVGEGVLVGVFVGIGDAVSCASRVCIKSL